MILALAVLPSAIMTWRASDYVFQDTYFVVANEHYATSLVVACAVFAAAYLVLRPTSAVQRRLAWAHFATFVIGCALIFWPLWVLTPVFGRPSRYRDPLDVFAWANWASSLGYMIGLLGLLLFVCFLIARMMPGFASKRRARSR